MISIKREEESETNMPLIIKQQQDFSFEQDKDDDQFNLKKENSYDNLFKHENNSVDLLLKEINNTDSNIDDDKDNNNNNNNTIMKEKTTVSYISPTKPLNLKNSSKTNLNEGLDNDNDNDDDNDQEQQQEIMQDIPVNPNTIPISAMKISSHLLGPRAVHETPKKNDSPSRKTVFIDASPPKMVEYERESSEEEEEDDDNVEDEIKPKWEALNPKKRKPLPTLQPTSADSSMMISPVAQKTIQFDEDDDQNKLETKELELTTEDFVSLKQMTMEEKLNAVLDNQTNNLQFDHDKYLEDAKFKRTKSVVKRTSYYDDMLLNSIKSKQDSNANSKDNFDGLADLYDSNIRNTQSERSLKLDLNRSNSVQSQFSIASGERVLETSPVKNDRIVSSSITMRDGIKGFDDDTMEELTQENQIQQQPIKQENHLEDLTEISSSFDIFENSQLETKIIPRDADPIQPTTHTETTILPNEDFSQQTTTNMEELPNGDLIQPTTPVKVSHSRHSSLTDALSPYKVGAFLVNVGSNLKKIVRKIEPESDNNDDVALSKNLKIESGSDIDDEVSQNSLIDVPTKSTNDDELQKQEEQQQAAAAQHTEEDFSKDTSSEEYESAHTREIEDELLPEESAIGNSTELVDDSSATLEDSMSSSLMEISKHEYQLELSPEFDDDPHSFSLELDERPISNNNNNNNINSNRNSQISFTVEQPRKIASSNVSNSSSPQVEVLSIWQSQPEFKHVPRHQTTRCSSLSSANNSITRNSFQFQPRTNNVVNVISKRVVSREYDDGDDDDNENNMLPNISGDSDFGSDFKKMGIKIDEEDESDIEDEIFHDSQDFSNQDLSNDKKNVQSIWRTGTIARDEAKPNFTKTIDVFSDEQHQVKNVNSTVQVNQPFKTHGQHGQSVEIENVQLSDDDDMDSMFTAIKTINNKEVSGLANLSEFETTPARPLGAFTQSQINSLSPPRPKNNIKPDITNAKPTPPIVKLVNGESGRLFIRLNKLSNLELPDYHSRNAKFCVILDNGIHRIQTDYFKLDDKIPLDKEFELICQESVSIVLTLKAKYDHPSDTLIEVKERQVVKSKSFFGKIFGNKHVITRTKFVNKPAPYDPWSDIMANDGSFGKVVIELSQFQDEINGKPTMYQLPILNEWNNKKRNEIYKIGVLNLQMLFLPRVSKFEIFPTSIKEAIEELKQLQNQKLIKFQGYLFQEGGDCKFMKRRFFKLQDSTLTAFNEDTLKTRCKINLTKVVEIIYMNDETTPSSTTLGDRNFSDNLLSNSFKLRFANNEIIEFNAQDKFEKIEWIQVLQDVISKNHFARQPWVKLMHQRQQEHEI